MKVSVILLTYNHEAYIEQSLHSVLSQKTSFDFEVLVSEDCSTDRTREIVKHFADEHSDRVRLFLSESNLNTNEVTLRALRAARGEYIAFLDGDDYWTSDRKLDTQVLFMDEHPEYAVSHHNVLQFWDDGSRSPRSFKGTNQPLSSDLVDLIPGCFIAGCSAMIRLSALRSIPDWYVHNDYGDWPLYFLAARHGRIGYIPESLGAYRMHSGGVWTGETPVRQFEGVIRFYTVIMEYLPPDYRCEILRRSSYVSFDLGGARMKRGEYRRAFRAVRQALGMTSACLRLAHHEGRLSSLIADELWGGRGRRFPAARRLVRFLLSVRLPGSAI